VWWTRLAEAILGLAFLLSLWPRPHSRAIRSYLAPVVGSLACIVLSALGTLPAPWGPLLVAFAFLALLFQPFFLLRLVVFLDPRVSRLLWPVGVGTVVLTGLVMVSGHLPVDLRYVAFLVLAAFFLGTEGWCAHRLWLASRNGQGSARQRAVMLAVASGAVTLLLVAVLLAAVVHESMAAAGPMGVFAAAIAVLYLTAVAPPQWLRHAWQMPVLYAFNDAANATDAADVEGLLHLLLDTALGATGTAMGGFFRQVDEAGPLYTRDVTRGGEGVLFAAGNDRAFAVSPRDALHQAWVTGSTQLAPVDAEHPAVGVQPTNAIRRVMVVPVRAGGRVIGLLRLFTALDWIFLDDALSLLEILADQTGARLRVAQTLTQEKDVAQALRDANRALEAASTAKSDFLSSMSHELRTPLNAIIGFSDLLLQPQTGPLTDRQRRYVGNVLESGQHLLQIVNDVLDIAKADASRLDIRPSRLPVRALVDAALLLVRPQAAAGGVELVDASEGDVAVWADELRARQALVNLLSNAVKFTPADGKVTVRTTRRQDGFVDLAVEDTGIGIAAEDLSGVFDEFTQVSHGTDRAYEGTGLGLPLVRRLSAAMGGGVRAQSTPGAGSVFTIWLPDAQGRAAKAAAEDTPGRAGFDRRTVLVVDDDRMVRELCLQVLGQAGFDVEAVGSLAAARDAIAARPPDLIFLDILLGDEYGDGLFAAVDSLDPRPRVVVMSIVDAGRRPLPGRVDAWLVKPVRPDHLVEAVGRVLGPSGEEATVSGA